MEHRVKYIDLEPGADPPAGFDVVEVKLDGHWAEARFDGRGVCEIYTRTGTLRKRCEVSRRLPRMTLIGEYMYGTPWSTQEDRSGRFYVFDIVPKWWQRPSLTKRWWTIVGHFRTKHLPKWFWLTAQSPACMNWRAAWDKSVQTGKYEGLVFKKSNGLFGEPHARMKRVHTVDFVCEGFNPGKGKFEGVTGSILGSLYVDGVLKHVCRVGGLTDIQRKAFTATPEKFIGRVFEAEGRGRFESGALRHPSFLRWRNDKRPTECTWST